MSTNDDGMEAGRDTRGLDLRDYWLAIKRHWRAVALVTIIGSAGGFAYGHVARVKYAATAEVLVEPATQAPLNPPARPDLLVNMVTEQSVAQSGPVVAEAAMLIGGISPATLESEVPKQLAIANPTGSDVLQITWTAPTAAKAQNGANAFAEAYLSNRHATLASQIAHLQTVLTTHIDAVQQQISSISGQLATLPANAAPRQALVVNLTQLSGQLTSATDQLNQLKTYDDSGGTLLAAALPPQSQAGLGHTVVLIIGLLIGLIIGLIAALVAGALDGRVWDRPALRGLLGAPVLAVLPNPRRLAWLGALAGSGGGSKKVSLAGVERPDSAAAEAVRALRATIPDRLSEPLLVSSADGQVSASWLAAELGVAFAEAGHRTVLVASDLRGSDLPRLFSLRNDRGLAQLLSDDLAGELGGSSLVEPVEQSSGKPLPPHVTDLLSVLPNGPLTRRPLAVLDSPAMETLLSELHEQFDVVILDSPPADVADDWLALAKVAPGMLVLAAAGRTRASAVAEMHERASTLGARILGGVLVTARAGRPAAGSAARRGRLALAPSGRRVSAAAAGRERPEVRPEDPSGKEALQGLTKTGA